MILWSLKNISSSILLYFEAKKRNISIKNDMKIFIIKKVAALSIWNINLSNIFSIPAQI